MPFRVPLVGALLAALAIAPAQGLGGTEARADDPFIGASTVLVLGSRGNNCTGVVIRQDVVLTAAHCVRRSKQIAVGYFEGGTPTLQEVVSVVRHPRADQSLRRAVDIALVRLKLPLPRRFAPIALDAADRQRGAGETVTVAGLGLVGPTEESSDGRLRSASVRILAPTTRRMIRIGLDEDIARLAVCKGDSGGPVIGEDGRLAAVVFGVENDSQPAICGAVAQAIRIAPNRAWIDRTIAGWR
jgi:hypothetical protein